MSINSYSRATIAKHRANMKEFRLGGAELRHSHSIRIFYVECHTNARRDLVHM